jgi:O-antigen ligase
MGDWSARPIFGAGFGAVASDNFGSSVEDVPWAYELQYVALLFQVGVFGMLVYGGAVLWLMYQLINKSKANPDYAILMIPSLVGLSCFLIANATNPYISKFDYLWTLFLPVGLVNFALLNNRVNKSNVVEVR